MRHALLLSAVLLLPVALPARGAPPGEVSGERALSFVTTLADDSFRGRKSGLGSGRQAEEWVAARLREFGLSPGSGESWFHELRATVTEELPTPRLAAASDGTDERTAEYGKDFVTLSYSGAGVVEGEVVFAGYGIHAPERGRDDYSGLDATGRVVVALRGKPPGAGFEEERQIGYKSSTAFERGAVGFLLVEGDQASSGTIQEKFFREPLPAAWISRATADDLFRRAGRPPLAAQVEALQAGKPASFPLPGVRVRMEIRTRVHRDAVMRNVMGLWPGETDEVVVLSAHLDHLGVDGAGRVLNGADDNASGSGMLLEVARAVAASGRRFRRGLLFVWFAAEEQGLLGSKAFVEHPPVPLDRIAVLLNTDMCGQGRPVVSVGGTGTFPRVTRLLGDFDVPGVEVRRGWRSGGGSDQAPFVERGIPAFSVHTVGPHPNYHTPEDDASAIRPELLRATGKFVRTVAERAAACEERLGGPGRRAEYLWHDAPVADLFSGATAPRGLGIDLRVQWNDGDVNALDAVLTTLEAGGAEAFLVRPGTGTGAAVGGRRPGVLLGLRGAAATRIHRPAQRLGVTVFAPFLGPDPATDAEDLFAFAGTRPVILCLEGAPADLDPAAIPAPLLLPPDLALRRREELSRRTKPWLAVVRLAPLRENKAPVHAEVAREIAGLVETLGPEHVLLVPGDPADATYVAQAPTLHPGVVGALLAAGLTDDRVRPLLGGNLLRILAGLE